MLLLPPVVCIMFRTYLCFHAALQHWASSLNIACISTETNKHNNREKQAGLCHYIKSNQVYRVMSYSHGSLSGLSIFKTWVNLNLQIMLNKHSIPFSELDSHKVSLSPPDTMSKCPLTLIHPDNMSSVYECAWMRKQLGSIAARKPRITANVERCYVI